MEYPQNNKYRDFFSIVERKKDLKRKAVQGGAIMVGVEIACVFLRVGSMTVLARVLLPEDFGLLAMVIALTLFAERFKDLGLADATVQATEVKHVEVSNLFWINLSVSTGIAILLAYFSKAIAWFYHEPRLTAITLVIAPTFIFSGLTIQHLAVLRRQLCFGSLAFIQLFSVTLSILVAIVLAYRGFGYWALVAREFSRAVFVVVGTWIVCPWRPDWPRRRIDVAHLLSFGKNVTGFNLIHFFSHGIDKILVGKLQGPYWVGLYTNAYQLIALPVIQIDYPVKTVALPALSALQTEPTKFREYFENILQLLTFFSMPVVAFIALFGDIIVGLLLGPKWKAVVPIFQILAVGTFIGPVIGVTVQALVAYGRTKEYFRFGVINSLSFICCVAIGSVWGTMGVAIGYSTARCLTLVLSLVYSLRYTPIRIAPLLRRLTPNCFCSLLTILIFLCVRYAMGWVFKPQWLLLFAIAGVLMYLGLWSIVPGGRRILWSYWNKAINAMSWMKR